MSTESHNDISDKIGIFLFHRDFRTIDNISLNELSLVANSIIPIFIFTHDQVGKENSYYNKKAIEFMTEALSNIPHLQIFCGDIESVLESIFVKNRISYIGFNLDYTKYAQDRTKKVKNLSQKYGVKVIAHEDYTLLPLKKYRDGSFYKVFKPFYNHLLSLEIPQPSEDSVKLSQKYRLDSRYSFNIDLGNFNHRKEALEILKDKNMFKKYIDTRNTPSINTTMLSKYIKFGCVSIREVYQYTKKYEELARQVIWHDFYANLLYFLPHSETLGGESNFQHRTVIWDNNKKYFKAWCNGMTGFPIIDAGMRQLNNTGWMHNRVRLLTGNFLSLILGIDWRLGEKYFAQNLIDYDPASNNLNWQFTAQVGTDRNPFLRIYNPFTQGEKYDKECKYIKKWIPELEEVPNKNIHKWFDKKYHSDLDTTYPIPIVDMKEKVNEAKNRYKK